MQKWEIRPPLPEKALNRSSPKFAWVITSGTQPLGKISSRSDYLFSPPRICENSLQVTWLVFWGSSDSVQPRPLNRFLRSVHQMTSFHARMCLLGVQKTKFYISTPFFPNRTEILGKFLTELQNFRIKKTFTMAMLTYKNPSPIWPIMCLVGC